MVDRYILLGLAITTIKGSELVKMHPYSLVWILKVWETLRELNIMKIEEEWMFGRREAAWIMKNRR